MNISEATAKACEEPTLLDALSWIAVWESERAIQQARKFFETGERTGSNGAGWDTCFKVCFQQVMEAWKLKVAKSGDSSVVINHEEAKQFAQIKRIESNLARCYLDAVSDRDLYRAVLEKTLYDGENGEDASGFILGTVDLIKGTLKGKSR